MNETLAQAKKVYWYEDKQTGAKSGNNVDGKVVYSSVLMGKNA